MSKFEYLVLDWELPMSVPADDREHCFCREGVPVAELAGLSRKNLEEVLNHYGRQGWELVQAYDYRKFYLKRRVSKPEPR